MDEFFDPKLIHNKAKKNDSQETHLTGLRGCTYPDWNSSAKRTEDQKREKELYKKAMQVYCDLESGFIMKNVWDYPWPM